MKILVTGGCGFIGSAFIRHVLESRPGVSIVNLDKLTYAANPANLAAVAHRPEYRFVRGDIVDPDVVAVAMEGCDAVVNFAAETHVDRSLLGDASFIETDVRGVFVLLEEAKRRGVRKFVQISTDEVYGTIAKGSFTEESPLNPRNPYAASKAGGDRLAYSYWASYGMPVIITRASNNYGPYQYPEKLIPLFVTNAIDGQQLPLYGDGKNVRDWLFVRDHAAAIDFLLDAGKAGETYNVAGGNEAENIEITRRVLKELGRPEIPDPVRGRPARPRPPILARRVEAREAGVPVLDAVRSGPRGDGALVPRPRRVVAADQGAGRGVPRVLPVPVRAAARHVVFHGEGAGVARAAMPDAGGSAIDTHAAVLAAPRTAPRARRRILVTGATGMLGSDLAALLASAGYDVLARGKTELDVTHSSRVARALRELQPDVVVNCAAFTRVDDCETDPRAFQVNAEGVAHLADACGHVGAQLAQISTDFVFDGGKGEPYREDDPVEPLSAYGRSKRAGEEEALRLPGSLVVRASWLFGRSGWNFVEAILKQVESGKPRLAVVTDQVGRPTATTDLSEAILALLEAGASGVYHFANRGEVSWNDFAREILWLAGRPDLPVDPTTSEAFPRPARRPPYSVLDTGKYERLTGRPIRHFRDPLAEYIARRARPEA